MEKDNLLKEIIIIIFAAIILGISFMYPFKGFDKFTYVTISFLVIFFSILIVKKLVAYNFETSMITKFWSVYQFGFMAKRHFKNPVPFFWLPIVTSLLTRGIFIWMPILEFDIKANPERVSRRHGLYRYTEVTEWHVALIAFWGIITTLFVSVIGYVLGFETFAKLGITYALWSVLPISSLDGSKIFFGSKNLWFTTAIITLAMFLWSLTIIVA